MSTISRSIITSVMKELNVSLVEVQLTADVIPGACLIMPWI